LKLGRGRAQSGALPLSGDGDRIRRLLKVRPMNKPPPFLRAARIIVLSEP
jgi:hypothetical protein